MCLYRIENPLIQGSEVAEREIQFKRTLQGEAEILQDCPVARSSRGTPDDITNKFHFPFPGAVAISWRWSRRSSDLRAQRRRHNGWSCPPSCLQVLCWLAIPVVAPSTAFLLIPAHLFIGPIAVLIATIWLILQIVVLTSIDPAVPNLRKDIPPAHFDATKHEHVIEQLYCNICLIHVDTTCKHCRTCNKCISGFDHHCKWLNNCIGATNYRLFLLLVLSVCCIAAILTACFVALPVISFVDVCLLPYLNRLPMKLIFWRGLCLAASIPFAIVAFLCAHLLYFHYKLWQRGMTTYKFIRVNKEQRGNPQLDNSSVDVNTISGAIPMERNCSKRSFIKSRAVHDSSTITPYPSYISQSNLSENEQK